MTSGGRQVSLQQVCPQHVLVVSGTRDVAFTNPGHSTKFVTHPGYYFDMKVCLLV